jgi:hypothetical protein
MLDSQTRRRFIGAAEIRAELYRSRANFQSLSINEPGFPQGLLFWRRNLLEFSL